MTIKRTILRRLVCAMACALLCGGCSSEKGLLPLYQFQDIGKQQVNKNRVGFQYDVDISPVLAAENVQAAEITFVKASGKIYLTAPGFKNLYCIVPHSAEHARFKAVQLKRAEILPFQNVQFEWAEHEQVLFKWQDNAGEHSNVIDENGEPR